MTLTAVPTVPSPLPPDRRKEGSTEYSIPLVCAISGITLGKFVPATNLRAGTSPYLKSWKETTFFHPIFSMSFSALLHRAHADWLLEKSGTQKLPMPEKKLQFLALLHSSECIRQDFPCLPSDRVVELYMSNLLEVLDWLHDTHSQQLHFPRLHIGKIESNKEIDPFSVVPAWLAACEVCKDEWENRVREKQKVAKQKAAVLAMKSIRKQMYQDISLKRLWNWVGAQVPSFVMEDNADLEQLFFTEEAKIAVWEKEDIVALEDLILTHCETGNSISFEVFKRIKVLKDWLHAYTDTFEIEVVDQFKEMKGLEEPKLEQFSNRATWLVAHARWKLGNRQDTSSSSASSANNSEEDQL